MRRAVLAPLLLMTRYRAQASTPCCAPEEAL
jgi:hypothetical protein